MRNRPPSATITPRQADQVPHDPGTQMTVGPDPSSLFVDVAARIVNQGRVAPPRAVIVGPACSAEANSTHRVEPGDVPPPLGASVRADNSFDTALAGRHMRLSKLWSR